MKILTIANPRSGSTYFGQYWATKYDVPYFHEPKLLTDELQPILDNNNEFSMKIIVGRLYYDYHVEYKLSFEESIDKFYNLIKNQNFNHIIILDRRDKVEHTESVINLLEENTKAHNDNNLDIFKRWVYDEHFKRSITNEMWDKWYSFVTESTRWLTAVSEIFNIPITYYEDLYYNPTSIDLGGLEFVPDLSKKLRRNPTIL
jgi:hypothetical protein